MLTTVEEVWEFRRVVESFPHFVASHVWIADGGGTRFVPWPWQVRLARVWRERRQVVILKARQLGVSWLAAAVLAAPITGIASGCRSALEFFSSGGNQEM